MTLFDELYGKVPENIVPPEFIVPDNIVTPPVPQEGEEDGGLN